MAKFYEQTMEFQRDISYNLTDKLFVWKFW